jgi:hypothetical protein
LLIGNASLGRRLMVAMILGSKVAAIIAWPSPVRWMKSKVRDERLLAQRRANRGPDKLRYPGLSSGLVVGSGEFFPQGHVRSKDREGLFDDIVGPGWCIIASEPAALDALSASQRDFWKAIGGRFATVAVPQVADAFEDVDGIYRAWFAAHSCSVAVVRPDWYLYATARKGKRPA